MSLPPLSQLSAPPLPAALAPLAITLSPTEAAKLAQSVPAGVPAGVPQNAPAAAVQAQVIQAQVIKVTPLPPETTPRGGVVLTLKLPNGAEVEARSPVPLPLGSTLSLPLPPAVQPALQPNALSGTNPPVVLRALVQPAGQNVPLTPTNLPNAAPAVPTTANLPLPILTLTSSSLQPAPFIGYPTTQAPPGPLLLQLSQTNSQPYGQPLLAALVGQPLTLTLKTPTSGTLQLAETSTKSPPTQPVAITLPGNLNLPLRTPLAVLVAAPLTTPATPTVAQLAAPQNVVAFVLPKPGPQPEQAQLQTSRPAAFSVPPSLLAALRVILPNQPVAGGTVTPPPSGIQLARVVGPTSQGTQPLLLANGQVAQLEVVAPATPLNIPKSTAQSFSSPHNDQLPTNNFQLALPAGTVLLVNIPIAQGPVQVLQLHSNQPQLLPQGAPAATANTVAPVQTPQAVLATGSVVAGTITGQNAQGQPLLTLTSPAQLVGQTFALTLQNNPNIEGQPSNAPLAASLVIGTKVQVQVTENGLAQLLGIELPPGASRATTLAALGSNWATLQQSLNLLQNASPEAAAQARSTLPALANFLPGLIRLLEGIKDKDHAKILGAEAARLSSALGSDLTPELAQLNQLLAKNPEDPTNWRGFIFPYLEHPEGNPQQGSFLFRRETEDDARSPTSTRFVAELNLSQLGAIQLDGLVQYPEIWLKLRTQTPPPEGFAEGLQQVVAPLLANLQLAGGIAVETTAIFPINPQQALRQAAENPLGISS